MRILVTGGAGYIGSHVCKRLAEAGMQPIVYDNLSTGHRWAVKWGPLIEGDLADKTRLMALFDRIRLDAVIHLAARAYVGESVSDPARYYSNNYVGTLNLLECMRAAQVNSIVYASSCSTYGIQTETPIPEDAIQRPVNPYGESKYFAEQTLAWYAKSYGLRFVTLRFFNVAGADAEAEIGEVHIPETHLIPLAIQAALGRSGVLEVFGNDYRTNDGTAIRDYIHVSDVSDALVSALRYSIDGHGCVTLNLGSGTGHSVTEVVRAVERETGQGVPVCFAPRRSGDPPVLVADVTRARELLGWSPARSTLDNIVTDAIAWEFNGVTQAMATR